MKYSKLFLFVLLGATISITSCNDEDDMCLETSWYQDVDADGLGNPDVSVTACVQPTGYVADNTDSDDTSAGATGSTPVAAFDDFNESAVTISFDGDEITIESTGLPNHTSPYWPTSSNLYIEPNIASVSEMSPGTISSGSYTVTVPAAPVKASSSSATGLGAIGIAVTGAPIFNDEEGPNIALSENVASGFDYAGAHMGPTGYHYHLESSNVAANTTLSYDDEKLVGILQDGFLLYGRKCDATSDHPSDLDASGGHIAATQHSDDEEFYHYHIINETYIGSYILLFGAELQGTPNTIM